MTDPFEGMSPRQVEAVSLLWLESLSLREVARRMGIAASSVQNLELRAKQHLKRNGWDESRIREMAQSGTAA